jgi:hypothetical protein
MSKNNSALVFFVFVLFVSMILGIAFADGEDYRVGDNIIYEEYYDSIATISE